MWMSVSGPTGTKPTEQAGRQDKKTLHRGGVGAGPKATCLVAIRGTRLTPHQTVEGPASSTCALLLGKPAVELVACCVDTDAGAR